MATQYIKEEGSTFIAASQRPDGSWRKPRRVKDGFVPQEEVPLYESKGKKLHKARDTGLPPGLTPEAWERMKQQQQQLAGGGGGGGKAGKAAKPKIADPTILATGLTVEENVNGSKQAVQNNSWTTVSSKSSKKKNKAAGGKGGMQNGAGDAELAGKIKSLSVSDGKPTLSTNNSGQPINTDPAKRLKNLRKKVIEIEKLQEKDPSTLDKDQIEKISRLPEILNQIEALESEI